MRGRMGPKVRTKIRIRNLDLNRPPDPTATFQEMQGPEKHVKHQHIVQSVKSRLWGTLQGKQTGVFNKKRSKIASRPFG